MRTTVSLDDELLATAEQLTNVHEKSALLREALKALIEREVLDASEIKLLVEGLDLPPIKPLPAKTDDGVQQVIKPERSPAKGGERPATA